MKRRLKDYFEYGNIVPAAAIGSALVALLGIVTLGMLPDGGQPVADIRIEPTAKTLVVGETFTIDIIVAATIPVNVFAGELQFNPAILRIVAIDYNTSIAELWAELPWFSNGDGTLNFAGGTTKPGGFVGQGSLITITFEAKQVGNVSLVFADARILQHDGLGSEATVASVINNLFTITDPVPAETIIAKSALGTDIEVIPQAPTTDLNGDGKQTIADISIFMADLVTGNRRSDFNQDGKVNTADLSILMQAK